METLPSTQAGSSTATVMVSSYLENHRGRERKCETSCPGSNENTEVGRVRISGTSLDLSDFLSHLTFLHDHLFGCVLFRSPNQKNLAAEEIHTGFHETP